jgi:hypothetical protein
VFFYMTRSAPYEKSKFLGSGGSMVSFVAIESHELADLVGSATPPVY